ncbi:hypothetical protein CPB84DRAFT_593986 [Gymnopilus junonius]|uniref:Flavin-containing monooxygenase n=1 Tax=Gymnopilus junonius TaxID=109634 RepID=A0A9P5NQT8_GYMJU|nr:hypothetical protein CPB84DRAFT_593986 [Gymnopilus junonius]
MHRQVPLRPDHGSNPTKSLAIVGSGSAGLAMLKNFLDLDAFSRDNWQVVLYEEREDVGGICPIYDISWRYIPPGTPLYPSHEHIKAYHRRYAQHNNLLDFIKFNHKVHSATWTGTSEQGFWNLALSDKKGALYNEAFDHLVVASGNNHIPRVPVWKGQDDWLSSPLAKHSREIVHSVYYRRPEVFANRSVLIVGSGASGRDAATQIVDFARQTVLSTRHDSDPVDGVPVKPEISHFTSEAVVFIDGTSLDPDVVLLGTGYQMLKPFLTEGGELKVDPSANDNSSIYESLVTNTRYIFPLYRHILSLNPRYPTNALAFIGLPSYIANCPSDYAQSLFTAHVISNPSLLPPRAVLLKELASYEENVRANGLDPYTNGHRMLNGTSSDYQDELVEFLKEKNAIPDYGKKYVEKWRRRLLDYQYLRRGWLHIEKLGKGAEWTKGVESEAQWADLMERVNEWQQRWETENGIAFKVDFDLAG